jgi:hypothetical protein
MDGLNIETVVRQQKKINIITENSWKSSGNHNLMWIN